MLPTVINGIIPPGVYPLAPNETLELDRPTIAEGVILMKTRGENPAPSIRMHSGAALVGGEIRSARNYVEAEVEILGSEITLERVKITGGYCGFWVRAGSSDIVLRDCVAEANNHNCRLGDFEGDGWVRDVLITGGRFVDSETDDGIKTLRRCQQIRIVGVDCSRNAKDGIDLFAGADGVEIEGCVLEGNGAQGVDIKVDAIGYPPEEWGVIRNILIKGTQANNNGRNGVKIWRPDHWPLDPTQPQNVVVRGCSFEDNWYAGVISRSDGVLLDDCDFVGGKFGSYLVGIPTELSNARMNWNVNSGRIVGCRYRAHGLGGAHHNLADGAEVKDCVFEKGDTEGASLGAMQSVVYTRGNQFVGWGEGDGRWINKAIVIDEG